MSINDVQRSVVPPAPLPKSKLDDSLDGLEFFEPAVTSRGAEPPSDASVVYAALAASGR